MFFLGLFVLIGLVVIGFIMLELGANVNNIGAFLQMQLFLSVPLLYLLPTLEAWRREHLNTAPIFLVNLFLGWTFVGWVVAAAWALRRNTPGPSAAGQVS